MNTFIRTLTLAAVLAVTLATAACGSAAPASAPQAPTSKLTEAQAAEVAENALQALNTGDYAAWSRDWSDTMKAAIKDADFQAFRQEFRQIYGDYVALEKLELIPGKTPGSIRWAATGQFANGRARLNFAFYSDSDKIDGVFPEAAE